VLLEEALSRFPAVGLNVLKRSSWWRSAAWPDPNGPEYRNGVALVEAQAPPEEVLAALLEVEAALGRTRGARNAPRTLDLDLIAYGREVRDGAGLTLPHPRAHERLFVMGPLAEIAPGWLHPVSGASAAELAAAANVGTDARPAS
jgi:2-amino-4-hydroxy-6-hydroxymethyldihydropteridine diphosphokinase